MFARKITVCTLVFVAVSAFGVMSGKSAAAADQFVVDYRATTWKTAHFDDSNIADSNSSTLAKLGCEVKKGSHGGHYDVSFVCRQWRRISLKSHDQAHQWEKWLKASGFETRHAH